MVATSFDTTAITNTFSKVIETGMHLVQSQDKGKVLAGLMSNMGSYAEPADQLGNKIQNLARMSSGMLPSTLTTHGMEFGTVLKTLSRVFKGDEKGVATEILSGGISTVIGSLISHVPLSGMIENFIDGNDPDKAPSKIAANKLSNYIVDMASDIISGHGSPLPTPTVTPQSRTTDKSNTQQPG